MEIDKAEENGNCCSHLKSADAFGSVCPHIYAEPDTGYNISFTGHDLQYDLVCGVCSRNKETAPATFTRLCENCFQAVQQEKGLEECISGRPQMRERASSLRFIHRDVSFGGWNEKLLCIQPDESSKSSRWITLSVEGKIFSLDFDDEKAVFLMQLPGDCLDLDEAVSLHLSARSNFVAVVNKKGGKGCVIRLETKKISMHLKRGDCHNEPGIFPIAFFENDNRTLLVHGTAWNRLDISDPLTGELLTQRELPIFDKDEPRQEHYLDYFHCGLTVSPDNKWIVDNGWVWAPAGVVRSWNLEKWLSNVWESENGQTVRELCVRDYFWDGPLCWIDNQTLAVWGFGRDDEYLIPAILLFDVVSGKRIQWFAGPRGELTFDKYLFSSSQEHGTSIWDIATGERLHHEAAFSFLAYHRNARQFVTYRSLGQFQISHLSE